MNGTTIILNVEITKKQGPGWLMSAEWLYPQSRHPARMVLGKHNLRWSVFEAVKCLTDGVEPVQLGTFKVKGQDWTKEQIKDYLKVWVLSWYAWGWPKIEHSLTQEVKS